MCRGFRHIVAKLCSKCAVMVATWVPRGKTCGWGQGLVTKRKTSSSVGATRLYGMIMFLFVKAFDRGSTRQFGAES